MRVTDLLRTMDIFETLPVEELDTIAQLLHERRLAEGEILCRQGEPGDALFIVTGGRIRLSTTDPSGNEKILTYFGDGQFFGEMAVLTGAPRSASATAETDCQLLVLDKDAFDDLLASHAPIMREMLKVISQRTLQTNQQLMADEQANAAKVGAGHVFAIFSPRGGSGKTTVAVNLAAQRAREVTDRTALLDLSLTFGHTAAFLGLEPHTSLAAVPVENLADFDRLTLSQYLVAHSSGLQLLVAGTRPEEGEIVTAAHVRAALGTMRRQFSATFVDCGSSLDDPTIAALEIADRIVVVCTPELNTLRDVRECQRMFGEIIRLDLKKVSFLFNHNQPFTVLSKDQFESALEQPMLMELPHAGDAAYKAASSGQPLVLGSPNSAFTRAIEKLVRVLEPGEPHSIRNQSVRAVGHNAPQTTAPAHPRRGLFNALRGRRAS